MTDRRQVIIDPLSGNSLIIFPKVNDNDLGTATGFVVQRNGKYYLITNWHVVTGRHTLTGKPLSPTGGLPELLEIAHHRSGKLGYWKLVKEPLYDGEKPLWLEHPLSKTGSIIDLVALPITHNDSEVTCYPFNLDLAKTDILPQPAMPVSIIGFPLGLASFGALPIWKTGHIASDPDLDYRDDIPAFLIDATTRSGMSGSPVVLRTFGGYQSRNGDYVFTNGTSTLFLGVYSGRIHDQSEIGLVWRPRLIEEIIDNAN